MEKDSSFNRGTDSFDVGAEAILGGAEGGEYETPEFINRAVPAEEAEGNSGTGSPDGGHQWVWYKVKKPPLPPSL